LILIFKFVIFFFSSNKQFRNTIRNTKMFQSIRHYSTTNYWRSITHQQTKQSLYTIQRSLATSIASTLRQCWYVSLWWWRFIPSFKKL